MKKLAAAGVFICLAGAAAAGGLAEVETIVQSTPTASHDWVVLVLLAALIGAVASN